MKKPVKPSSSTLSPANKKPAFAKSASSKKPAPKPGTRSKPSASKKNIAPKKQTKNAPAGKSSAPADTSSRIAALVVIALDNLKAKHVVTIDVRPLTEVMDTLVIASGTSNRHVKALAENAMLELKKQGFRVYGTEGEDVGEWVLVDFGGVVLHVMQPHIREFYDLERLWSVPTPAIPAG